MAIHSVSPMVEGETAILLVALLAAFTFAGLVFTLLYPYVSGEKQTEKRVASVTETRAKKASSTGVRSAAVANFLRQQGFKAVNLAGGLDEWARSIDRTMRRY